MSDRRGTHAPSSPAGQEREETASSPDDGKAWREYQLLVEVYKFYLDLAVKFVAAYFAIVGTIVTVVLANPAGKFVPYALWVPVLMSLLVAVGTWKATPKAKETREDICRLARQLDLASRVHVELLVWIVSWYPVLALVVALLLSGLFVQQMSSRT